MKSSAKKNWERRNLTSSTQGSKKRKQKTKQVLSRCWTFPQRGPALRSVSQPSSCFFSSLGFFLFASLPAQTRSEAKPGKRSGTSGKRSQAAVLAEAAALVKPGTAALDVGSMPAAAASGWGVDWKNDSNELTKMKKFSSSGYSQQNSEIWN